MEYNCAECGGQNQIPFDQPVLCKYCGSRVLFKTRTKEILQYEAR